MNRNEEIMDMIRHGKTRKEVAEHFGISATRVTAIYQREYEKTNSSDPDLEVYQLCMEKSGTEKLAKLVYNGMRQAYGAHFDVDPPKHLSKEDIKHLRRSEFAARRGIGDQAIMVFDRVTAAIGVML